MADTEVEIKQEVDEEMLNTEEILDDKTTVLDVPIDDPEVENMTNFTEVEITNTSKCLDNIRIIIKDFETQVDWHLKQYMMIRNFLNPDKNTKPAKDNDLLSISQLTAMIAAGGDCNTKFLKRRPGVSNGTGRRKSRNTSQQGGNSEDEDDPEEGGSDEDSDEEDYDSDEEDGYYEDEADEERYGRNDKEDEEDESGGEEDAGAGKGKKGKKGPAKKIKDEIDEELHELPNIKKEEMDEDFDDSMDSYKEPPPKAAAKGKKGAAAKTPAKKTPAKRGRGRKKKGESDDEDDEDYGAPPAKTTARGAAARKSTPRGKKAAPSATITSAQANKDGKNCAVVLERINADDFNETEGPEFENIVIKKEEVDEDDGSAHVVLQSEKDRLNLLFDPKLIVTIEALKAVIDGAPKKPLLIVNEANFKKINFATDLKKNNVVIGFDKIEDLPDFVYDFKQVTDNVLNGNIHVVHKSILDEHLDS